MFNIGQRTAVAGAFKLAGYEGPLYIAPVRREGDDERAFLFSAEDFAAIRDVRTLQQLVGQVLGCKVYIAPLNPQWGQPIPFE